MAENDSTAISTPSAPLRADNQRVDLERGQAIRSARRRCAKTRRWRRRRVDVAGRLATHAVQQLARQRSQTAFARFRLDRARGARSPGCDLHEDAARADDHEAAEILSLRMPMISSTPSSAIFWTTTSPGEPGFALAASPALKRVVSALTSRAFVSSAARGRVAFVRQMRGDALHRDRIAERSGGSDRFGRAATAADGPCGRRRRAGLETGRLARRQRATRARDARRRRPAD